MGKGALPAEDLAMADEARSSRDEFIRRARARFGEALGRAADATNGAPPGRIISGSGERVRALSADLRRETFEVGSQVRADAAEAAFPPSGGPGDGQGQAE
jgi:hypothetical protein